MATFPMRKHHTKIGRWDPFEEIARLNARVNQMFDRFGGGETEAVASTWLPALDVIENDKTFTLKIDVPGMEKKDLSVQIEENALVLKGERKSEKKEEKDNYVHLEREYGSFFRSYPLPDYVDQTSIKANCKDGVLTVELTKVPGKKTEAKDVPIA